MRRRNRASWIALVRQLEQSRLTQQAFADQYGVKVASLRSWIYRLRREKKESPPLVPVRVIASTAPTARWPGDGFATRGTVEVALPDGVALRFADADAAFVADLVGRLRRPSR